MGDNEPGSDPGLIRTWKQGMVGYLEIHRPEKANAYNQALLLELAHSLDQMEDDQTVRALVVCGAGNRSFCAGADLEEMQTKDYSDALNLKSSKVFAAIASYPKVTVSAINGAAVAGGLELALACDIRICSEQARFFFPETNLGLIPAAGGTHRLSQVVGVGRAKELILGGGVWSAQDALRFGLVSEVVSPDAVLTCAQKWGERIGQRDPLALRLAKKAIDFRTSYNLESGLEAVTEALLYQLKINK
jgi:enoyl-CoA hydratase/carnithine racemase